MIVNKHHLLHKTHQERITGAYGGGGKADGQRRGGWYGVGGLGGKIYD